MDRATASSPITSPARALLGLTVVALVCASTPPAHAAAPRPVATWQMNERPGARTMLDSTASRLNGVVGSEVSTGVAVQGATAYRFSRLAPNTAPAHPQHNVVVPDDDRLDPGAGSYSVEVRYRTTSSFGNLVQKGQSGSAGGYWKIQLPQGEPSCLFRGAGGVTTAVRAQQRVDDGAWHVVRCARTDTALTLYVDGAPVGTRRGSTGPIANSKSLLVGGKDSCDQIKVTCDYFAGDVDWIKITRP